jgi:hypothetical protein
VAGIREMVIAGLYRDLCGPRRQDRVWAGPPSKSASFRGVAMLSPWFGMTGIGPGLQVLVELRGLWTFALWPVVRPRRRACPGLSG